MYKVGNQVEFINKNSEISIGTIVKIIGLFKNKYMIKYESEKRISIQTSEPIERVCIITGKSIVCVLKDKGNIATT